MLEFVFVGHSPCDHNVPTIIFSGVTLLMSGVFHWATYYMCPSRLWQVCDPRTRTQDRCCFVSTRTIRSACRTIDEGIVCGGFGYFRWNNKNSKCERITLGSLSSFTPVVPSTSERERNLVRRLVGKWGMIRMRRDFESAIT